MLFFNFRFALIVRGFTLNDLLDKPWLQICLAFPLPPVRTFIFVAQKVQHFQFGYFIIVGFDRVFLPHAPSNKRAMPGPFQRVRVSVRLKATTLTSAGTRFTLLNRRHRKGVPCLVLFK